MLAAVRQAVLFHTCSQLKQKQQGTGLSLVVDCTTTLPVGPKPSSQRRKKGALRDTKGALGCDAFSDTRNRQGEGGCWGSVGLCLSFFLEAKVGFSSSN